MWMLFGLSAGIVLGLYDFWTKKAMVGNSALPVVFWSSLFGALAWLPAFLPVAANTGLFVDVFQTSLLEQTIILVKSLAMTVSWLLAYFSVRELPMSFSGAVRASGPLWTFVGGAALFGEMLSLSHLTAVATAMVAYFILSTVGASEGVSLLRGRPMLMMLVATLLSAMTTVYDKYIVHVLSMPIYTIQAYSALHQFLISFAMLLVIARLQPCILKLRLSVYIPLVGLSWVSAELIYFVAVADPSANVTYLSIFRRISLVVGFVMSALLIGEHNVRMKSIVIGLILLSTAFLVLER